MQQNPMATAANANPEIARSISYRLILLKIIRGMRVALKRDDTALLSASHLLLECQHDHLSCAANSGRD